MSVTVRKMRMTDISRICEIAAHAWRNSTYEPIEPDVDVFVKFLKESIVARHAAAFVASINERVEGVIIGHIYPWYFSRSSFATERFFLVSDIGKGVGARLLFRFLSWAKAHDNVNIIHLVASSGMPNQERVERLYGKLGKRVGSVFHIEV